MTCSTILQELLLSVLLTLHTGFYHKLVTTGNENKEPADIEPLIEEADGDGDNIEPTVPSRLDVRRRSSKKVLRHHSIKKGNLQLREILD